MGTAPSVRVACGSERRLINAGLFRASPAPYYIFHTALIGKKTTKARKNSFSIKHLLHFSILTKDSVDRKIGRNISRINKIGV